VRPWHDPQKSMPLLLKAQECIRRGIELSEGGNKREAAKELRKAEELRQRAREPLGKLVT
jgi:hypothetical protein